MRRPRTLPAATALLVPACQAPADVVGAEDTDGSGGSGTAASDTDSDSSGEPTVCRNVDILFVIDNAEGMATYQDMVAAAVPEMLDTLGAVLPDGVTIHLGATTTSFCDVAANPDIPEEACGNDVDPADIATAYISPDEGTLRAEGFQGRLLPALGADAWVTVTVGDPSTVSGAVLGLAQAVTPGEDGCHAEFPSAAIVHALTSPANEGFARDDGILGLFVVTDGVGQSHFVENPSALESTVLSARSGCGDDCIVAGGMFDPLCTPDENTSLAFLSRLDPEPTWGPLFALAGGPSSPGPILQAFAARLADACVAD